MAKLTTALVVVTLMAVLATGCTTAGTSNDVTGQPDTPAQDGPAASQDPGSGSIDDNGEDGEDVPDESPIGAAVTEVAGYTEIDVSTAVNNARFDSIIGCMTEQGWDYGYDDLPEAGPSTGEISYFGTQIQYYLDELDRAQRTESETSTGDDTEPDSDPRASTEFSQNEFDCWVQAEDRYPDPLQALWLWLADETEDLDTEVRQDPRIAAAREASERCFAMSGYDTSIEDAANLFNGLANDVWERFRAETISADEARTELLDIQVRADEVEDTVASCDAPNAQVQGEVRAEYEQAFLDENGDKIALIAKDYAELLKPYLEFLQTQ